MKARAGFPGRWRPCGSLREEIARAQVLAFAHSGHVARALGPDGATMAAYPKNAWRPMISFALQRPISAGS